MSIVYIVLCLAIMARGLAETCHRMQLATALQCPKFTKENGVCIVDQASAFGICAETPGCEYVLMTSNANWNMLFPDAAMLGKGPLRYDSEWKSCELPASTGEELKPRNYQMVRATQETLEISDEDTSGRLPVIQQLSDLKTTTSTEETRGISNGNIHRRLAAKLTSRDELKSAVDDCLEVSSVGDCSTGRYGPISKWDVSGVTGMNSMFNNARSFNCDISKWDVSRVTDMNAMFFYAGSFNSDISKWTVSQVTNMNRMFLYAGSFNSDISKWDVSQVTNMYWMFRDAKSFNSDISKWDVSRVTNMNRMFLYAGSINSDISKWNVSQVTNMEYMFFNANSFNHTLCGEAWVNSNASKAKMFLGSSGSISGTICAIFTSRDELKSAVDGCLKVSSVGDCSTGTYGPISKWDVSRVTGMNRMFFYAKLFNSDISKWNVSQVTNMIAMFYNANSFNIDISKWDVSQVTDMAMMFVNAKSFKSDISKWDVSQVTDMALMFSGANSFNSDISKWDVSQVTSMNYMFYRATSFNNDISEWDVSQVTSMNYMFSGADSFNIDISKWNVSQVNNMNEMFGYANLFNHKLCGEAWVNSNASKREMFLGSSGSISGTICEPTKAMYTTVVVLVCVIVVIVVNLIVLVVLIFVYCKYCKNKDPAKDVPRSHIVPSK